MRHIWTIAIGLAVLTAGMMVPERAECCTVGPGGTAPHIEVQAPSEAGVRPEGPVVLPVRALGADAESFAEASSLEVVGESGDRISGELEVEEIWHQFSDAYTNHRDNPFQQWLIVWRPDVPMLENEQYEVTLRVDREKLERRYAIAEAEQTFTVRTGARGEPTEPPTLESVRLTNVHEEVSLEGASHCTVGEGGMCPTCRFTDKVDTIRVRARFNDEHYRHEEMIYELRALDREPTVDRRAKYWGGGVRHERLAAPEGPALHFRPDGAEFCVQLVAHSLVDGSERVGERECFGGHHDSPDTGVPIHDAGPGDTGSPHFDTGGRHPDDRFPDTGTDSYIDTGGGESDAGPTLPWGGRGERDGCACSANGQGPPPAGWLWGIVVLSIGGWWRRRREEGR